MGDRGGRVGDSRRIKSKTDPGDEMLPLRGQAESWSCSAWRREGSRQSSVAFPYLKRVYKKRDRQ